MLGWFLALTQRILYCTLKSYNLGNERTHIPRTWYCFSIHGPGKEVWPSLALWTSTVTKTFYCIIFIYHLSPFKLGILKKTLQRGQISPSLKDSNYDLERNDTRNILSLCHLNLPDFPTIYIWNCSICSKLSMYCIKLFSRVTLKTLASTCSKMYCEPLKWQGMGYVWPII